MITSLQPRLTEKTYEMSSRANQIFVFDVDTSATKPEVAHAIEDRFKVKVTRVRLLNNKGKAKRTIAAKGRKVYKGKENRSKKAYVTLKAGDSLPFFQAIEEEEAKQEKVQKKMEQAMEKQEAKETKAESKSKSTAKIVGETKEKTVEETKSRKFLHLGGRRGNDGSNK